MPFPLQHPKGGETASHMMPLCPLRASLTSGERELILAHPDDFFKVGTEAIQATHLRGWQCQAIGHIVLGAVSDDQDLQTSCQPAASRPIRMAPVRPERLIIEPSMLRQTTHKIPAIVPNALQHRFGRIPGITEDIHRATTQAVTGLTE
jgi:hypothetical protein